MRTQARDRPSPRRDDAGFTMVEMMVAVGIFATLMALIGGGLLRAMSGLRSVDTVATGQLEASVAMEQLGRYIRYMALPKVPKSGTSPNTSGLISASSTALTFYSYAGTGSRHDIPYLVEISVVTARDRKSNVVGKAIQVVTTQPSAVSNGQWTWDGSDIVTTRRILTVPTAQGNPLAITSLTSCDRIANCPTPRTTITPTSSATGYPLADGWVDATVTLVVGGSNDTLHQVTQEIALVNQL
jgi:prepilin-type N-terminal cleavage/methylation domain-containing protein